MGWVLHSIFIDEKGVAPLIPFLWGSRVELKW
jgi:hypothetical protein